MEIILIKDVPGLGFKDEVVKVKNGYGRNFIIPKGLGVLANTSNSKVLEENLKQTVKKQEELLKNAEDLSKKIGNLVLEIKVKTGAEDKMFGSVTTVHIAKLLEEKGFKIDRKNISILNKINSIGEYEVSLKIHKDISHQIKIVLSGDIKRKKKAEKKKEENIEKVDTTKKSTSKTKKESSDEKVDSKSDKEKTKSEKSESKNKDSSKEE